MCSGQSTQALGIIFLKTFSGLLVGIQCSAEITSLITQQPVTKTNFLGRNSLVFGVRLKVKAIISEAQTPGAGNWAFSAAAHWDL